MSQSQFIVSVKVWTFPNCSIKFMKSSKLEISKLFMKSRTGIPVFEIPVYRYEKYRYHSAKVSSMPTMKTGTTSWTDPN